MQAYDANLMSFLMLGIISLIQLIVFYYILGKNYRNVEYLTSVGQIVVTIVLGVGYTISLGIFKGDPIVGIVSAPFIIVPPFIILYYVVKMVRRKRLELENILNFSKDLSINISISLLTF